MALIAPEDPKVVEFRPDMGYSGYYRMAGFDGMKMEVGLLKSIPFSRQETTEHINPAKMALLATQ